MKNLIGVVFFLLFSFTVSAQNFVQFNEGGIDFKIYLNGNLTYELPAGMKITRMMDNVTKVGEVNIGYNYENKVSRVGSVNITYMLDKMTRVGELSINYDYQGNVSGTSGQVNNSSSSDSNNTGTNNGNSNSTYQIKATEMGYYAKESDYIKLPEKTAAEKEYDANLNRQVFEYKMAESKRIDDTLKIYDRLKKNVAIPSGYHKVVVIHTKNGTREMGETIVHVVNNRPDEEISNDNFKIAETIYSQGSISLGKTYVYKNKVVGESVVVTKQDFKEIYFIDYLRDGKKSSPYSNYYGKILFKSDDKKVNQGKHIIVVYARPISSKSYDSFKNLGAITKDYKATLRAEPDTYLLRFFVIKETKKGYETIKSFDKIYTLTPNQNQAINIEP